MDRVAALLLLEQQVADADVAERAPHHHLERWVRVKNRLKSLYRSRGVQVAGPSVYVASKAGLAPLCYGCIWNTLVV
jgi:hypothetical protein